MSVIFNVEKKHITLGFMPLTDCAPLVVAKELGFFEKWGLSVTLEKQHSWATLRDKLHTGLLDVAQMLVPMPIASNYGLGCAKTEVVAPFVLSRNGNAITVSKHIYHLMLKHNHDENLSMPLEARQLKNVIETYKRFGKKLKFAVVFHFSCHYFQLISWLNVGGVNVDDVDFVIISPENMVSALEQGDIDGFCVGGPWNAKAVRDKVGFTGVTSSEIWPGTPEKVLAMLGQWQCEHKQTAQALILALYESCLWLHSIPNRFEAAHLLTQPEYLNAELDVIAPSLLGSCLTFHSSPPRNVPSYNQFSLPDERIGNCPDTVDGEMLIKHMLHAKQLNELSLAALPIKAIFSSDLYHQTLDKFLTFNQFNENQMFRESNEALTIKTVLAME